MQQILEELKNIVKYYVMYLAIILTSAKIFRKSNRS